MVKSDYSFHIVEIQKLVKILGEKCLHAEVSKNADDFAKINILLGDIIDRCDHISGWALECFRKDVR
jgi:hypothetical protein